MSSAWNKYYLTTPVCVCACACACEIFILIVFRFVKNNLVGIKENGGGGEFKYDIVDTL
jgi:hypothetical protein